MATLGRANVCLLIISHISNVIECSVLVKWIANAKNGLLDSSEKERGHLSSKLGFEEQSENVVSCSNAKNDDEQWLHDLKLEPRDDFGRRLEGSQVAERLRKGAP